MPGWESGEAAIGARPILFVLGEKDQVIPPEQALKQAHIPRIASVRILSEAGHMGMLEDFVSAVDVIIEFLILIPIS